MKRQLLFIASLFLSLSLSAQKQLTNPGFEYWEESWEDPEVEQPVLWLAPSYCEETCEFYYEKVQDGHTGLALKLKTVKEDPEDIQPVLLFEENFPAKPFKISFWYKSTCSLSFGVIMSAGPIFSNEEIIVGEGIITVPPSENYVKAELPIEYSESIAPEQLSIIFVLAKGGLRATDYAIIDDVELSYGLTSISNPLLTEVAGSNVISDKLELKSEVEELQIFNSSGVLMLTAANTRVIDTSSLPGGFISFH